MPDWLTVLFHVCKTDCPAGMSNSSFQPASGAMLALVTAKRAMKPVCHVCSTDNVAVTAAAWATGLMASPKMATSSADTAT
ncbi:hypothetical protein MMAN_06070 [Mycobacterium mantenii]|uniref:Chitinase n=1 Tax=Mycobacterium mantenii TaxID=560555 RepID=A0ABM7JLU3_MYCNT|nr:hypothetical protein MMAN_06070 [Mycobacterium mantenii]